MSSDSCESQNKLGLVFAAWLLRLWLGVRAIQTGIEKYAGSKTSHEPVEIDGQVYDADLTEVVGAKAYSMSNYQGVPESLRESLAQEPLMPEWALNLYDKILGPALLVLGVTILLGIANRVSLFLLGLLYISLTWGLILLKQDAGVAWLGVHLIMVAMALVLAPHNRLSLLKKW